MDSLRDRAKSIIYEQPDETISIALKLLKSEKKSDEIAHLYMLISNAYIAKRNNDSSFFYILKAADLIKTETSPLTKIRMLNSIAVQYQQMELYDKALETLDEAFQMTEKLTGKDRFFNSGFIDAVRGMIYREQSNPDLALEKFKLADENFRQMHLDKKNAANISIIYYNIGYCYIDLSQFKNAFDYFEKSEKFAKTAQAKSLEAYALKGLGESLFLTQQYAESRKVLYRADELALPVGDLVLNEGIYKLLANNNLILNNFADFQKYNNKYLEVQKNLKQNELKSLNRYLDTQNAKEHEDSVAIGKRYLIYEWIVAFVSLLISVVFIKNIYGFYKSNRRQRKIIESLTKTKKVL